MRRNIFRFLLLGLVALNCLIAGCEKENNNNETPTFDEKARDAFYDLMQEWYLWYDQMPAVNPENYYSPYDLLEALRVLPVDRWSYVSTWEEFMQYYSAGEYIGFGFGNVLFNGKIYITFVFKDSPLYDEGIRRGWYITKINGQTINSYEALFQAMGPDEAGVERTFEFVSPEGQTFTRTFVKEVIEMNTLLHADTLHVAGEVVGHMVLKSFIEPTYEELDSVFQVFDDQGVEELILDLRYNGGGAMGVCTYLASQISGPATNDEVFLTYSYNDQKSEWDADVLFTDPEQPDTYPLNQLGLSRLLVLASAGTASASEAVINGLEPYMEDVIIIGDDTYGKPVGMNVWNYEDAYAFAPVTFKLVNSEGYGDYYDGLPADSYVPDEPLYDFGDRRETTLKEAIYYLETGSFTGAGTRKAGIRANRPPLKGLKFEIGAF